MAKIFFMTFNDILTSMATDCTLIYNKKKTVSIFSNNFESITIWYHLYINFI